MRNHVSSSSRFQWNKPVLVTATVVAIVWVGAGDLNPPPGAIQPTNRVQLNEQVISLPFTIGQRGSYFLTSTLTGTAGQDGIVIDADDVTLDLNGFCLTGVVGSLDGIRVNGSRKNTTIRNGTISGWDGNGINATSSENGRFESLSIGSSGLAGLWVGSDGTIRGLNISGSGNAGIRVGGARNRVDENHVTQNGTGILVDGLDNLIIRNSAADNGVDYNIAAGNAFGPIAGVGGVGDISVVPQASHPWANFGLTCVPQQWCLDGDGDGFGDSSNSVVTCTPPPNFVSDCTDCDDADPQINPGATEVCNGVDDNCDGSTDEGAGSTWCEDMDADGFGNAANSVVSCTQPPQFVSDCTDCNDQNSSINPGATEVCNNGVDDNCDGTADEGCGGCITALDCTSGESCCGGTCVNLQNDDNNCGSCGVTCSFGLTCCNGVCTGTTWCQDGDGDGFGNSANSVVACAPPQGFVSDCTDCNDLNSSINPSASEVCDALDNDCNTLIDDGNPGGGAPCDGPDADLCKEGVLNCVVGSLTCSDATTDSVEVCNGTDDDCDGVVDEGPICGANAACLAGACSCDSGFDDCNTNPADGCEVVLNSDPNNCGSCGLLCPVGASCVGGACQCPAGTVDCGGGCVDVLSDSNNCGACGNSCAAGDDCCNGSCADLTSDVNNCGGCGLSCPPNTSCVLATCCKNNGEACGASTDCCSGNCLFGTCIP